MSTFSFTIGDPDETTGTVAVSFVVDGETYTRNVNSVGASGDDLTLRVLDVGRALINKIAVGVAPSDDDVPPTP